MMPIILVVLPRTGGSAAGSVVATPNAYRRFFRNLVRGNLLNAKEQALFNGSFVSVVGLPNVEHGFGVFRFDDPEFGPGFAKSGQVTRSGCQLLHFGNSGVTVVACRNSVDAFLGGELPNTCVAVGDLARELIRTAIL